LLAYIDSLSMGSPRSHQILCENRQLGLLKTVPGYRGKDQEKQRLEDLGYDLAQLRGNDVSRIVCELIEKEVSAEVIEMYLDEHDDELKAEGWMCAGENEDDEPCIKHLLFVALQVRAHLPFALLMTLPQYKGDVSVFIELFKQVSKGAASELGRIPNKRGRRANIFVWAVLHNLPVHAQVYLQDSDVSEKNNWGIAAYGPRCKCWRRESLLSCMLGADCEERMFSFVLNKVMNGDELVNKTGLDPKTSGSSYCSYYDRNNSPSLEVGPLLSNALFQHIFLLSRTRVGRSSIS